MRKDFIIPLAIGPKPTARPSSLGNTGPRGPDGTVARGQAPVAHKPLGRPIGERGHAWLWCAVQKGTGGIIVFTTSVYGLPRMHPASP
jgi:hypothetical protein